MEEIENFELGLDAHVRGGDDDGQLGLGQSDASQKVDPVGIWEPHVQDGDVRLVLLQLFQRLGTSAKQMPDRIAV